MMRLFLVSVLCLLVLPLFSQETRVIDRRIEYVYDNVPSATQNASDGYMPLNFYQGSLESALELARRERKLVFLDFYADWCGPCKLIEKEVFVEPEFYNYVNNNFVVVKVIGDDLSPGGGFDYAEKMKVGEWPTLMVLNHKGKEMGRVAGYKTAYTYLLELKRIERFSAYLR